MCNYVLQLHFTITIKNGTITIPVLNRNYYVRNLCSIERKAILMFTTEPIRPNFKCYDKARLS